MSGQATSTGATAKGVRWDLSQLFPDAAAAGHAWERLLGAGARFQSRWQGRLEELDAAALGDLLDELGGLMNEADALRSYSLLRTCADSGDAESQDLQGLSDRRSVEFENLTRFFQLEWEALPGERAAGLASAPRLAPLRHFLVRLTEDAGHSLGPEAERVLAERSPAATGAWQQLAGQTTSAISVDFAAEAEPPRPHTLQELLAYQFDERSEVRQRAEETVGRALQPWTAVLAKAYDALVGDRLAVDRLRNYVGPDGEPLPMRQANWANDLSDASVDAMIEAVESHYPLTQHYFETKARLLGLPVLRSSDVGAPLGEVPSCDYGQACRLALNSVAGFSSEAEKLLKGFFAEGRVDAEPRPGKRGGAFCEDVAQDRPAFILINYTDSIQEAGVLAHELGHGLHAALARRAQTPFTFRAGMALAEVPSTFGDLLFSDHVLKGERDPKTRRTLRAIQIERSCLTIFRQVMLASYEQLAYAAKARGESLSPGRLSEFWLEQMRRYYGSSVELSPASRWSWARIPHFIDARFYTYSYAFAHLVSLALYARYQEQGEAFVPRYLELLAAGASRSPADLLAACGVDISNPQWVEPSFAIISGWTDEILRSN